VNTFKILIHFATLACRKLVASHKQWPREFILLYLVNRKKCPRRISEIYPKIVMFNFLLVRSPPLLPLPLILLIAPFLQRKKEKETNPCDATALQHSLTYHRGSVQNSSSPLLISTHYLILQCFPEGRVHINTQ
jgi:hypothetical protein